MEQNGEPRNKPTWVWANNFQQRSQKHVMEKRKPLQKWCWENWKATCKKMKLDYSLFPCTNIYSKQSKYLNIRCETTCYIGENIGTELMDLVLERIL